MKVAILVHGFNVINPQRTVGKLRPYFEVQNYTVESLNYGFIPFVWQLEKKNPKVAIQLKKRIQYWQDKGVSELVIVGHSNGCAIMNLASGYNLTYDSGVTKTVAINPALVKDKNPFPNCFNNFVLYNSEDKAVIAGKWLLKFAKLLKTDWLKPIPWGEMGRTGYKGKHTTVTNINTGKGGGHPDYAEGHSTVFDSHYFCKLIVKL